MNPFIDMFSALSQETRLEVFRLLVVEGPEGLPAGEIARRIGTPSNTMSAHLSILERSQLVRSRREGRSIIYSADTEAVQKLVLYLLKDCCQGNPDVCSPILTMLDPSRQCETDACAPVN